jgi:hypothetical protein
VQGGIEAMREALFELFATHEKVSNPLPFIPACLGTYPPQNKRGGWSYPAYLLPLHVFCSWFAYVLMMTLMLPLVLLMYVDIDLRSGSKTSRRAWGSQRARAVGLGRGSSSCGSS